MNVYFVNLHHITSAALALTNLPLFSNFGEVWSEQGVRSPMASQRAIVRAHLRPEPEPELHYQILLLSVHNCP